MSLLGAAVRVKVSSSVVGTYTTGCFDVAVEPVDAANNLVRIQATPKEAEPKFFFKRCAARTVLV